MAQTNNEGLPTSIKDDRYGGRNIKMDKIQQVIVRSVCLDGYAVGIEVGRRLAAKEAAKEKAEKDLSAPGQLTTCLIEVGSEN